MDTTFHKRRAALTAHSVGDTQMKTTMRRNAVAMMAILTLASVASAASIPHSAVLFVEPTEFGQALAAALLKKQVPVRVTTDREKATHLLLETHAAKQEGQGERVAKVLMLGGMAGSGKSFEATVSVTDRDGTVLFAHNMKKGNFQSAAEGIAKHLKKHIEENAR